jgi:hypothetical protein
MPPRREGLRQAPVGGWAAIPIPISGPGCNPNKKDSIRVSVARGPATWRLPGSPSRKRDDLPITVHGGWRTIMGRQLTFVAGALPEPRASRPSAGGLHQPVMCCSDAPPCLTAER